MPQPKLSIEEIDKMLSLAFAKAKDASEKYMTDHPDWIWPCGFAFVNISPARGKLVNELKARGIGYVDTYYNGYTIWDPSPAKTGQICDAKMAGAKAFAAVLKERGYNCCAISRVD